MKISPTDLPGVILIDPQIHSDERGFFMEIWRQSAYREAGIAGPFMQDNLTRSGRHAIRGLHFQEPNPQGKLVTVLAGAIFDVAVDIRRGSANFGRWTGARLDDQNRRQIWVPPGFAHGFCVTSESADVLYKVDAPWSPDDERVVRFDDPEIGIDWPSATPLLSAHDRSAPSLADCPVLPGQ